MNALQSDAGVLLVAHGTRDLIGQAEVRALADRVTEALAPRPVETGFIELAEPTIVGAFNQLVGRGAKQIRIVPLLLFAAGHAKADLPDAICEAESVHRDVGITVASPFGLDDRISLLSRRRFDEAVASRPLLGPDETYWLLVGRGSSDPEATLDFGRFAGWQARQLELPNFGCAFAAVAQPMLESGLARAAETVAVGMKRIVVQPHLLFRGAVLDQVHAAVALWQKKCPMLEWLTCAHLGPEQELVEAVIQRVCEPET